MSKLKLWKAHSSWEKAEEAWEKGAREAARTTPLKGLRSLPKMPGMTCATARGIRGKSLKYIVSHDRQGAILKQFLRHPFRYGWNLLRSLTKKKSYLREGDFFLYGIASIEAFASLLKKPKTVLVVGFSYCHKPFECPSGRFNDQCLHDADHPVCRQCFIGKAMHALPDNDVVPLVIPTIHYIGEKMLELTHRHPQKELLFLITACEMTLEMGGDLGNMIGAKGIGIRLDGRICNTMDAFLLSELGVKPGLTVVLEPTQRRFFELLRLRKG